MVEVANSNPSAAEAEVELWHAFKDNGSISARERLFSHYAPFARNIAKRHYRELSRGDIELAELFQLAYAGLLEALDRYDPVRGVPFRPFAAYRISGSIRDGLTQMSEVREQLSWQAQVRRERVQSLAVVQPDERSDSMSVLSALAVGVAIGFMLEGTGLYSGKEDEGGPAPAPSTAYESLAWSQTVAHLFAEFRSLPEREATILRQHYLCGVSFDNIAAMMGVTKGRVSQIHRAALMLLRKRMHERGHFRLER